MLSAEIIGDDEYIKNDIVNIFVGEDTNSRQVTVYEFIPNFKLTTKKNIQLVLPVPAENLQIIKNLDCDNFFNNLVDHMDNAVKLINYRNLEFDNNKKYKTTDQGTAKPKSYNYLQCGVYHSIELLRDYAKIAFVNNKVLANLEPYRDRNFAFIVADIDPKIKGKRCIFAYSHDKRYDDKFYIPTKIVNSQDPKDQEEFNLLIFSHGALLNKYYQNEVFSNEILILPNFTPKINNYISFPENYMAMVCFDKTKKRKNEDFLAHINDCTK